MPDKANGVNNGVSCYKEAAQFSASFVMALFASFIEICKTAFKIHIFHPVNTNYKKLSCR